MNFLIFLGCAATFNALSGLVLMALEYERPIRVNGIFGTILFSVGTLVASFAFGMAAS